MPNIPTLASLAADLDSGRTSARKLVEECLSKIADSSGEGERAFIHSARFTWQAVAERVLRALDL